MDSRAPASSLYLYKETGIDLESPPNSVVQIQLPSSSSFSVRPRQQQRLLKATPIYRTADTFSKACLASSGSVHFSRHPRYPRSILWRVLQDRKVLELRSVDVSKNEQETKEATLVLQLFFPSPIKDGGVALADSHDKNVLNVFVLTKSNELYTCCIERGFFCNAEVSRKVPGLWCKIFKPATFSISTPHRLVSGGPLQLIVSLTDGRILRLTREENDDGSRWTESVYGDGQWTSSLLGLVRWQGSNTVRYDGSTLEQNTPIAMALSPDHRYIFAVCLNHTLRIWNPDKAASVFTVDLLWQHREPHDVSKVMLDPGNANVLEMFRGTMGDDGDLYYAITFSPHDFGQFKFWGIRDPDHAEAGIRDLFPDTTFRALDPDPNPDSKAIWKVADFKIHSEQDHQGLEMWILMRSGRSYKLYKLSFDLQDLDSQWQDSWCLTASESTAQQSEPQPIDLADASVTAEWLEYILKPGRYPESILETGLSIYIGDSAPSRENVKATLKDRMCSAVAAKVNAASRSSDSREPSTSFQPEWTALHQDIRDLNKSRHEVLSLAYDHMTRIPQVVFAGSSSLVRSCSRSELVSQNSPTDLGRAAHLLEIPSVESEINEEPCLPDDLAILIKAAGNFRSSFNHHLQSAFAKATKLELWQDPSYAVPLRIQALYDQCNFADDVAEAQFDTLNKQLEATGGFDKLDTASFKAIMDTFAHDIPPTSSGMLYTTEGLKLLVTGAREMIGLHERVLTDLLAMVTLIEMEADREENPMEKFDGPEIYTALLDLLKSYQVMQWLVTHVRMDKSSSREQPLPAKMLKGKFEVNNSDKTVTILESIFARDLKPQSTETQTQSAAVTQNIQDLLQWVVGGNNEVNFDEVPVYIQCDLLKNGDLALAEDFLAFQPSTSWSTYIRGRFFLMKDKPSEAATMFKKAAFNLSNPSKFDYYGACGGLLSPTEAAYFGHGLCNYYTHIIALFNTTLYPVQTSQFAHLALQLAPSTSTSTPTAPRDQSTTTHLLETLFHSSLSTSNISTAYSALIRHPSPTASLLPTFIKSLLAKSSSSTSLPHLLSLPFPPSMHGAIDNLLSQHSQQSKNPKILAAWRLHHNDFRAAAAALLPSLRQAQWQQQHQRHHHRHHHHQARKDQQQQQQQSSAEEREVDERFLMIINLLACVGGKDEGWVLSGGSASGVAGDGSGSGSGSGKPDGARRKVLTLQDVRDEYARELDRRSVIENGRWAFGGGGGEEDMDVS